jgi:hypothetical protein
MDEEALGVDAGGRADSKIFARGGEETRTTTTNVGVKASVMSRCACILQGRPQGTHLYFLCYLYADSGLVRKGLWDPRSAFGFYFV